ASCRPGFRRRGAGDAAETPVLCREKGRTAAEGQLRELSLDRVKSLLDDGIERRGEDARGEPRSDPYSFGSE
ncbi:MAG: hypothetical protein OXI50_11105, partial [Gammaproteobacteria bacterium]|nr:hypothetical protein [Gammaproteobacteria bacterium]